MMRVGRKTFSVDPRRYQRHSASKAFTYIELLVTLAIMAILLVPVMQLFSHTLRSVSTSQSIIVATNLARWQMERIKNLNFTTTKFRKLGTVIYPPLEESPLEMDDLEWRIKTEFVTDSTPLEVRVTVYYAREMKKPVITLITLLEDMTWERIVPGGGK